MKSATKFSHLYGWGYGQTYTLGNILNIWIYMLCEDIYIYIMGSQSYLL